MPWPPTVTVHREADVPHCARAAPPSGGTALRLLPRLPAKEPPAWRPRVIMAAGIMAPAGYPDRRRVLPLGAPIARKNHSKPKSCSLQLFVQQLGVPSPGASSLLVGF